MRVRYHSIRKRRAAWKRRLEKAKIPLPSKATISAMRRLWRSRAGIQIRIRNKK